MSEIDEIKEQIKELNRRIEELERKCRFHTHLATGQYGAMVPTTQPIVW